MPFPWASFKLLKFTRGPEAEGNISKETNYLSLNLNAVSFVLFSSASEPSVNCGNSKLAYYC